MPRMGVRTWSVYKLDGAGLDMVVVVVVFDLNVISPLNFYCVLCDVF